MTRKQRQRARLNRVIQIVNPTPNGSAFTTRRQALELERRGRAVLITISGEVSSLGTCLFLLDVSILDTAAARKALLDFAEDQSITRDRKGIFFWNGADHSRNAAHRPFENVVLAKPGRIGTIAWINHQLSQLNQSSPLGEEPASLSVGSHAVQARRITSFPSPKPQKVRN